MIKKWIPIIFVLLFIVASCDKKELEDADEIFSLVLADAKKLYKENIKADPYTREICNGTGLIGNIAFTYKIDASIVATSCKNLEKGKSENLSKVLKKLNIKTSKDSNYWLSTIGFNDDHTFAIIYEENNIVPGSGYGAYYILQKTKAEWKIMGQIFEWVS